MEHTSEDCQCEGKKCTKCTDVRCIGNYTKDKRLKSGLKSQCKICQNGKNKEWREENKEYNAARKKSWNDAHVEHNRQFMKVYREKNKDRLEEYRAQYYSENAEKIRKKALQYYYRNRGRQLHLKRARRQNKSVKEYEQEKWKEYYSANRERLIERSLTWIKENPRRHAASQAKRRTLKTYAGGSYTAAEFEALCEYYGNICLRCARSDVKLTADHVVPVTKGGSSDISNIQPLCFSCNSSKGTKVIDFRSKNP